MQVENKENCTGCGACFNICPKNAITMQGDEYGFYKPVIDKEKCVNCGLCEKVCVLGKYKSNNFSEPKVFALINTDEIRAKSTSGGAFSAFADYISEQNGIVYGVIWDENVRAVHYRAVTADEIEKIHGSKYVQSNTKDTFKQAKNDLESGKKVLFSGTPCQIAGLKSYLQKDYENLITIDLVCHGAQSPLVFEKYKKEFMQKRPNEKLLNINFRSKHKGWRTQYLTHNTDITTGGTNIIVECDPWIYLMNHTFNTSCCACEFSKLPRVADITIGDFWGVDEYDSSLNDDKGTSVVLVNNENGLSVLSKIDKTCKIVEIPLAAAIKKNPNIYKSSSPHRKRKEVLDEICKNNKTFSDCAKKYLKEPLYMQIYYRLPQFAKDFIKYKILRKEK